MEQYQNLEPNRGMYKGMRFPVAPYAEYPKWVNSANGVRTLVQDARQERELALAPLAEDAPRSVVEQENAKLAKTVTELSQALAEARAAPEQVAKENAELAKQVAELTKTMLALQTSQAVQTVAKPAADLTKAKA